MSLSGGEKLEKYLRDLAKKVSAPGELRVGFLESATYPDGTSVATVAAAQNFGSAASGIPPRPFFTDTIDENKGHWGPDIAGALKANDFDASKALALMGEEIQGELQDKITTFIGAPLKPATVARKGSSKQLVDTGHMLNSVGYEVTD